MGYPKTLGACIDRLYRLRTDRLSAKRTMEKLQAAERELAEHVLREFPKARLEKASGRIATASRIVRERPSVVDWSRVHAYVKAHDAFDLFQRRLHEGAVAERWDAGEEIPGVERFPDVRLSLTKRGKR